MKYFCYKTTSLQWQVPQPPHTTPPLISPVVTDPALLSAVLCAGGVLWPSTLSAILSSWGSRVNSSLWHHCSSTYWPTFLLLQCIRILHTHTHLYTVHHSTHSNDIVAVLIEVQYMHRAMCNAFHWLWAHSPQGSPFSLFTVRPHLTTTWCWNPKWICFM